MKLISLRENDFDSFLESKMDAKFIFFDTETTGGTRIQNDNTTNQLLQIAAIAYELKLNNGYINLIEIDRFDEKVRLSEETLLYIEKEPPAPKDPKRREFWLKTTRMGLLQYTHYDLRNTMSFVDENIAINNFEKFIKKYENVVLVAHNAPFDIKWLKHGDNFSESDYIVIDTCDYFDKVFFPVLELKAFINEEFKNKYQNFAVTKKNKKSVKLENLVLGFNNDVNKLKDKLYNHHNALKDCELTKDVFEESIRLLNQR